MTTNNNRKRALAWLVPLALVAVVVAVVVSLSAKRVSDRAALRASAVESERPPLPVKAARARRGTIRAWIYGQGTARAVRREYLTFETQGKVVYVKRGEGGRDLREGDRVTGPPAGEPDAKGELLARLDDRDLREELNVARASVNEALEQEVAARAALEQAKAEQEVAAAQLRRNERLFESKTISKSDYELAVADARKADAAVKSTQARINATLSSIATARARVSQAEVALERTRIHAPFDGVIAYLNIKEGYYFALSMVNETTEEAFLKSVPLVVIDPSQYEITLDVPSFDGTLARPGQPAFIILGEDLSAAAARGESEGSLISSVRVLGQVFSVNPAVNPGGRSVQVKVRTVEGAGRLRDGLFVNCWIVVEEKKDVLLAPYNALVYRRLKAHAYVVDDENRAVKRPVDTGVEGLAEIEIVDGVEEGEVMITEGVDRVSSGARVDVVAVADVEGKEAP